MTTPSLSWINRSRWSALLDHAVGPKPEARAPASKRSGWVDGFAPLSKRAQSGGIPNATAPTVPSAPIRPAPAVAVAAVETPPPPSVAPPTHRAEQQPVLPRPFKAPQGSLENRLQAFFEWVMDSVPCTAAFIADEHGLPLVQRGALPDHIAFSSSVLTLLESLEGLPNRWLSVGISNDSVLHLAEVGTAWGRFGVGIVSNETIRKDVLAVVQQGLERSFEE